MTTPNDSIKKYWLLALRFVTSAVERIFIIYAWKRGVFFSLAVTLGFVSGLLVFYINTSGIKLDALPGPVGWLGMILPIVLAAVLVLFGLRGRSG